MSPKNSTSTLKNCKLCCGCHFYWLPISKSALKEARAYADGAQNAVLNRSLIILWNDKIETSKCTIRSWKGRCTQVDSQSLKDAKGNVGKVQNKANNF